MHRRKAIVTSRRGVRCTRWAWIAFGAVLALGCAAKPPSHTLYEWTDSAGQVRYTAFPARIPRDREQTRHVVEPGASARLDTALPPTPTPTAAPGATAATTPTPTDPLDARIAELEAQVAADEEVLKRLITDPEQAASLRDSPKLREVGERLPKLQAELETLRAERAKAAQDDGS